MCIRDRYDAAKDEQGINESRIQELEAMLKNVKVIDSSERTNEMVHVGSKIKVHDYDFDADVDYQIVGASEEMCIRDSRGSVCGCCSFPL